MNKIVPLTNNYNNLKLIILKNIILVTFIKVTIKKLFD